MAKVIRYNLSFLGVIELDENDNPTEQQIMEMIADDYFQYGGLIEYVNDVDYDVEEI